MKKFVVLFAFLLTAFNVIGQDEIWNQLLKENVTESGKVNYQGFIDNKANFDTYLNSLSTFPWDRVRISKEGAMAFWINAYNAFTIKLIIDNYPLGSITELNDGNQNPWDQEFILMSGKYISLNHIEHTILRTDFNDPRIHFAINCASVSCPKLMNKAFTADNLEELLEAGTTTYINNTKENSINPVKAEISQLFQWFAGDFNDAEGSVKAFINKYAKTKISERTNLEYKEYNWDLND
jgi:hypothetical protein